MGVIVRASFIFAAVLIVAGAACIYWPAAPIVAGLLLAGLTVLFSVEVAE